MRTEDVGLAAVNEPEPVVTASEGISRHPGAPWTDDLGRDRVIHSGSGISHGAATGGGVTGNGISIASGARDTDGGRERDSAVPTEIGQVTGQHDSLVRQDLLRRHRHGRLGTTGDDQSRVSRVRPHRTGTTGKRPHLQRGHPQARIAQCRNQPGLRRGTSRDHRAEHRALSQPGPAQRAVDLLG